MRIKKNNRKYFWEIRERIIGRISSTLGAGLHMVKKLIAKSLFAACLLPLD